MRLIKRYRAEKFGPAPSDPPTRKDFPVFLVDNDLIDYGLDPAIWSDALIGGGARSGRFWRGAKKLVVFLTAGYSETFNKEGNYIIINQGRKWAITPTDKNSLDARDLIHSITNRIDGDQLWDDLLHAVQVYYAGRDYAEKRRNYKLKEVRRVEDL